VFEKMEMRRIYGCKRNEVMGDGYNCVVTE
jgi:hypothetical protein